MMSHLVESGRGRQPAIVAGTLKRGDFHDPAGMPAGPKWTAGAMTSPPASARTPEALRELGHQPEPVLKAVRAKCLDCSGGSHAEVADCLIRSCPLFPFRMGKNPWRAPPSEEHREAARRMTARLNNHGTIPGSGATNGGGGWKGPAEPARANGPAPARTTGTVNAGENMAGRDRAGGNAMAAHDATPTRR